MLQNLKSYLSTLERDPENEEALIGLEDILTGDDDVVKDPQTQRELEKRRRRLAEVSEWETVVRLLELELLVAGEVGDEEREVTITLEIARTYLLRLHNQQEGLAYLEKVLAIDEGNIEARRMRDDVISVRATWREHVRHSEELATRAKELSTKTTLFYRAAETLYHNDPGNVSEVESLLRKSFAAAPRNQQAIDLMMLVLKREERWVELAKLTFDTSQESASKDRRLRLLMAAAQIYAYNAHDNAAAAELFRQILEAVPGHRGAMDFLANYYENKGEWDELVALYEESLKGRLSGDEEMAVLLQIGMVHWRMRGDLNAAEGYFGRLRKSNPTHEGMLNFYREFAKQQQCDQTKLIQILSEAQRSTRNAGEKLELSKEIARVTERGTDDIAKATTAWKQVLSLDRNDPDAHAALGRLKTESGKKYPVNSPQKPLSASVDPSGKKTIFISYRRKDEEGVTGRIYDRLCEHFFPDAVFMDVEDIPLGVDFKEYLNKSVSQCSVLLAVIGDRWLDIRHQSGPRKGTRRLDDPSDFVRIEIESALALGIPVVPILVGQNVDMPMEIDLPDSLKPLCYRSGIVVDSGRSFNAHVRALIRGLKNFMNTKK